MVKLLKNKYNFLRDVAHLNQKDRKVYLKECCDDNIHTICEAVDNVLKNVCPTNGRVKKKVKSMDKELKKIANIKTKVSLKRDLLSAPQTGNGIFSIIASTVLPFLVDLLTKRKSK